MIDLTSLEAGKVSGTAGIESTKNCRGISRALVCCTGLGMLANCVHLVINCQLFVWMHQFFNKHDKHVAQDDRGLQCRVQLFRPWKLCCSGWVWLTNVSYPRWAGLGTVAKERYLCRWTWYISLGKLTSEKISTYSAMEESRLRTSTVWWP